MLPATLSGFCIALCSSHLVSRGLTLPLIDISVIYGTVLPRPSSNWRWACDLSPSDADAGCLLPAKKAREEAQRLCCVLEIEMRLCGGIWS